MKENEKKKTENVKEIFSRIQENLKNKWLLKISTTIILIAVILGCYFVLTMLMKDKWTLPEIDLTKNKIYSLSEETENKIKNIDKDIEITLVNFSNNDTVLNFADKYKNLNKKIKVEIVDDLTSRPDLVQKYSLTDGGGLILVASGENEKAIHDHDLYTYDYSTYETIDLTEEAITNAIVNVTADVKPKVYFMSNHLMYDIDYYNKIIQYMEDEANEVETIDIFARENIPEDCKCFVITTLKEDITEKEKDELLNYINNGGKLLLMCGPNLNGATLTNFQKVLDEYGITIENGVLFEGNNDNMLTGYPDLIVENINTTNIFKGTNSKVCLIDSANLKYDDSKSEEIGVEYNVLAETSEKAFIRTNLEQKSVDRTDQDSITSKYTIALSANKKVENDKESDLIIITNEIFAMNQSIQIGGYTLSSLDLYNNKDFVLNSIAYLNGRDDLITIRKNYDSVNTYTTTEKQNNIIMAIIFGLPLLIIIAGIVVWQVRRRKR